MDVSEVIRKLQDATTPERMHDGYIASLFGWRRKVDYITKEDGSSAGKKITWLTSAGEPGTVPLYTSSLDVALELARTISSTETWAAVWADGRGGATIGDGKQCYAATPAMALCVAALRELEKQTDLE